MTQPNIMAYVSESEKEVHVNGEILCRYLDWDSNYFGIRIARVEKAFLCTEDILTILAWCRQKEIDCLYFLANSSDAISIRLVEDYKFNLVDVRVTLEKYISHDELESKNIPSIIIDPAQATDIENLQQIAGTSIQDTRFYFDSRFPRERCERFYQTWIEESMKGFADAVLVAKADSYPVGFITCKLGKDDQGQIGLLGVRVGWEGNGIGVALVRSGQNWFAGRGINQVIVVTQGRNIPAQRLYQRCGFLVSITQLWYHRWFDVHR